MAPLPAYIPWIGRGAADLAAPARFTGAESFLFVARGETAAMQALVNATLNAASVKVRHEVIAPYFFVSFMDIAQCTSIAQPMIGWLPGRECAVWIPLLQRSPPDALIPRPVLWSPYIFINYTIGMVTGREVWGWPKTLGAISMPADNPGDAARFGCATTIFRQFSAATRGETATLIDIEGANRLDDRWSGADDPWAAARGALSSIFGEFASLALDALSIRPKFPTVVLKQFRDSEQQDKACYRAIVESPVRFFNFRGMALVEDSFELRFATCESHQIVRDLTGRNPDPGVTRMPVTHTIRAAFDFEALPGPVVG